MTAISGTRRAMKEMADGTLRVQIDIDPRFRASFFEMFGQIDMPVAIAPLVADFERNEPEPKPEPEKPKGGQLAKLAGMWCEEPEFWEFLTHKTGSKISTADGAAASVRHQCSIESRSDLDHNEIASAHFHRYIRQPYMAWLRGDRGVAA